MGRRQCEDGGREESDVANCQGIPMHPLGAGRGKNGFSFGGSRRKQPCSHSDISPGRLTSEF